MCSSDLTKASAAVGGADESTFFETDVDPTQLLKGTNTLAVEIHQSGGDSSDVSFNLQLAGLRALPVVVPELEARSTEAGIELTWPASSAAVLQASDRADAAGGWQVLNGVTVETIDGLRTARLPAVDSQRFFRLVLP